MIYSDEELLRWWKLMSKSRITEILNTMIDKAWSDGSRKFAESLLDQWNEGKEFSPRQIAAVKKWDR